VKTTFGLATLEATGDEFLAVLTKLQRAAPKHWQAILDCAIDCGRACVKHVLTWRANHPFPGEK